LFPLGDRVVVIPHGVTPLPVPADAAARRTRLGLPDRYLLTLSTMEPRKGLDVAVAALARPALAGQRLAVVGQPGWGGMDPIAVASRLGVDPDRITVLGRLDDADLATVLQHAAALLVPSRSEGFGLPVVEGMAAGIPVVHSDVPALVEVAGGAGLTAPVGDDRAWAETVAGLLADDALAAQLRALGRRRAAQFTWSATAELTWALHTG
jgi:glycosyltransferase involved in cell wall biosynthesis